MHPNAVNTHENGQTDGYKTPIRRQVGKILPVGCMKSHYVDTLMHPLLINLHPITAPAASYRTRLATTRHSLSQKAMP